MLGKAKRSTRRLGVGGELMPVGANPSGRRWFLVAVKRHVPLAVKELMRVARAGPMDAVPVEATDDPAFLVAQWEAEARAAQPFNDWLFRWHFDTDDWLIVYARKMVVWWQKHMTDQARWPTYWGGMWHLSIEPTFPSITWDACAETEADFRQRIERYIASIRATPGLVSAPTKRALEKHMRWLALHHIAGVSVRDLLAQEKDADSTDDRTIPKALADTARLIGLTLRTDSPARK